jgi:hypothetical protein
MSGDPLTREQAVALLESVDQLVQMVEFETGLAAADADELTKSQGAFHQSLKKVDIDDDDTLAATGRMQVANGAVKGEATSLAAQARDASALIKKGLESLGRHRQLSEAVQAHPRAAHMDFYRVR